MSVTRYLPWSRVTQPRSINFMPWLGLQSFGIRLDEKPRVGTPIRRSLMGTGHSKHGHPWKFFLSSTGKERGKLFFIFMGRGKDPKFIENILKCSKCKTIEKGIINWILILKSKRGRGMIPLDPSPSLRIPMAERLESGVSKNLFNR